MIKELKVKIAEFRETFVSSRKLLALIWSFDKKIFLANLFAVSVPAFTPFINAYIYRTLIDFINKGIHNGINYNTLVFLLGLRLASLLLQYTATSIQSFSELLIRSRLPIRLYQLILTKLSSLDVEYFENSKFKDRLQRIKETYTYLPLNMFSTIFSTYQSVLQLTIAFIAILTLNGWLAIAIIIAAIPSFINQILYSKTLWGVWSENSPLRKKFWYLSELIQDRQGAKEMKIFATARKFLAEITNIQKKLANENLKVGQRRLRNTFILNIFGTFMYILIEGFIAILTISGKITLGGLSFYSFVILNFENSVTNFFSNVSKVYDQSLNIKEIFKILEVTPNITTPAKAIKIDTGAVPKIEFKNVTFNYPGSKKVTLKNLSFTINPREKIAFVGSNGAGKTTIIKLLARFYDVTGGEILINGINIKDIDLVSWYKALGVIFQDFIKYEYTLGENIHFGKIHEPFNLAKIKGAARLSGTDEIAQNLDKGYDQTLGLTFEGGRELSLGQWQKVALARAFLRDAPLLVLDEPTASIDAKSEKEIFDKVEKLSRDKSVIIISHRFSTVRSADKIYVLNKGKIEESGNHQQLLKFNGTYAKLFNLQAQRYK